MTFSPFFIDVIAHQLVEQDLKKSATHRIDDVEVPRNVEEGDHIHQDDGDYDLCQSVLDWLNEEHNEAGVATVEEVPGSAIGHRQTPGLLIFLHMYSRKENITTFWI